MALIEYDAYKQKLRDLEPELKKLGVIDGIVREPEGGAQTDPSRTLWNLDRALTACLEPLLKESAVSLTERRYQKFRALGRGKEERWASFHRIEAKPSGDKMAYTAFSSISTRSATASASAPPQTAGV